MVFYFTGTGNSLYAATQLDGERYSIPQIVHGEHLEFTAERIGIVCPIYGHEMPAMVKEFIRRSDFHTEYLYLILTYGKRHANAAELAATVFKDAGKRVDYIATLLMVDNFLPVFDMTEETALDKAVEPQLAAIRSDIEAKKHGIEAVTSTDRAAHAGYMASVKNQPETVWADFLITDACIGCGICNKVCPGGCIHLENQRAVYSPDDCQACFACIHACPKLAIHFHIPEKNPGARYRNEHISLTQLVAANNQTNY